MADTDDGTETGLYIGALMMVGQRLRGIDLELLEDRVNYILAFGPIVNPETIRMNREVFEVVKEMLPHASKLKDIFEKALESGALDRIV